VPKHAGSATGEAPPAGQQVVTFGQGPLVPSPNLVLGRTTFPTSPLPPGMSDPDEAVGGNPGTGWNPGGRRRAGGAGRPLIGPNVRPLPPAQG
jgi:hypothetical protein